MEQAERFMPLDPFIRGSTARVAGAFALQIDDKNLQQFARDKLLQALRVDWTSADLMQKLLVLDLRLGNEREAQAVYQQFKHFAPTAQLTQIIEAAQAQKGK